MFKQPIVLLLASLSFLFATAQTAADSLRNLKKDSTLRALMHADSVKVQKEFAQAEKWDKIYARLEYPLLKGGKKSGIIPVKNPTEIPDPAIDYKILFELTENNPDSLANEINAGLDEIARVINLHVASGIPAKKIIPVIVVHGGALHALKNNAAYQKKYKQDNPSVQLMNDMIKLGATFIACGQAMSFFEVKPEELLPFVKISLTAQTVVSGYQLKGYVWHPMW